MTIRSLWSRAWSAAVLESGADSHVQESRERYARRPTRRDLLVSAAGALLFFGAAVPLAVLSDWSRDPSPATIVALVAAYLVVYQVEFEIGTGSIVPTQLVLVPMLFLLPTGVVPLAVAGCLLVDHALAVARRRTSPERAIVVPISAFHALGPAAVLVLAGEGPPELSRWALYLGALAAQFACDFASAAGRDWLVFGVPPGSDARVMATVYLVDAALAPVGLLAAVASTEWPLAFLLLLPLLGILAIFAAERRARIDNALELSQAYRGTTYLLGDVVEANDEYTGGHSREVVTLALAVADELRLPPAERRDVEFAALLHDVGKIRLPDEILNKPGPLTADERAVVERHTVDGQEMLERVGGLLGQVGLIVRSCHERWDGGGYPDGLAGEDIPRAARIVCCCDAFHAMTSARPYQAALPVSTALAELRANAGTQFDPAVVDALVAVLEREEAALPTPAAEAEPALGASPEPA